MTHDAKLVRDRIPEIVAAAGGRCEVRELDPEEYAERLQAKLVEEAQEFAESGDPSELADVLEVVRALAEHNGISWEDLERIRLHKRTERGGFARRLLMMGVKGGTAG
ncbi:MAG: nucleoside triphosphate pyrophosphohydrolase [Actinomycetota bacterium]|nr:nucleoside triphosphate pyrophosphohydrolase [Actinomycetota bacterium]